MSGTGAAEAARAAAGSSFYAGMRVLPKAQREAMYAVYAFCRKVDDVADDEAAPRADRRRALDRWRADLESLYRGGPGGEAAFLEPARAAFGLRLEDFLAVVDGMQMDADGAIVAPDLATLDLYCDRVASAVGRLSVRIFGMDEEPGERLAHHLGRALQLTNILRDLDEDAALGRLYLAREWLEAAGVPTAPPAAAVAHPGIDAAARPAAALARSHFAAAEAVLRARPRGRLIAPRLMGAAYGEILERMEAAGWTPPRRRARVSKARLIALLLLHGVLGR